MGDAKIDQSSLRHWVTEDFNFDLPENLIAQRPSEQRGESRLMWLPPEGRPQFTSFTQITDFFRGDEVLVLNDTRVVPARLHGVKESGGQVEVFFLERAEDDTFWAMTRGRLKPGNRVQLPLDAVATFLERDQLGRARFALELAPPYQEMRSEIAPDASLWEWLDAAGKVPLPPYIQRAPDAIDRERYQTVFAKVPGAVAAPTAGLHFTENQLEQLRERGVSIAYVTLHVGPGTFLPVKTSSLEEHEMHSERYIVPRATQELLKSGRPIIAVGTTVIRALESFTALVETDPTYWGSEQEQSTNIFITPGYHWRCVDGLMTNFHLPQSTLLMLVSAFAGYQTIMEAYQHAITQELRFYSYGDASLLVRPNGRWDHT